ncbi:MAG: DEAD/DEAH box helicase family protein [Bacilli bacterium]|nr:DEAD/DEAH box helicase family protein [Bacilli bacterium]
MFPDINIKRCYRTKHDDLKNDFFVPVLMNSVQYDRGTGFFSLDSLVELTDGVIPYIKNGGVIRVITSVELDPKDLEVIQNGIEYKRARITEILLKEIDSYLAKNEVQLDLISNLIAVDRLQIKIGYLPLGGLYHEKIGYARDSAGNEIWFSGSNNETYYGLKKNAESMMVLKSWQSDKTDIDEQKKYFETLWNNEDSEVKVFDIPEAVKKKILSKFQKNEDLIQAIKSYADFLNRPKSKTLYPYQEQAIAEFVDNKYNHFFEMATGTGKTFTAVKAVEKMSGNMGGKSLYVAVVVPQIDLQTQWERTFKEIGLNPHLFGGTTSNKDWEKSFSDSVIEYYNGSKIVVSICVYDTFFAKVNHSLSDLVINKLLIVDEAHELSRNQISQLSNSFKFRLGLSATPERHSAEETSAILDYFTRGKKPSFKYSIDDAIHNGFLSKYEYHPILVRLENDDLEFKRYQKLTLQLAQLLNAEEIDQEKIQEVLNNRSLIVKKARNKTEKIKSMILSDEYDFRNAVIYCGQGKDIETEESIIDSVTKALKDIGKYRPSQFTSKTNDRESVLREFENGYYDTLVAIKCFDQGVDVPKLDKIYIMASDTLMRQTIQRRGRVLRQCFETGKEMAYIYDLLCLPPEGCGDAPGSQSLVAKELKRATEYGRLAENKNSVTNLINKLISEYNITEASDDETEINN